MKEITIAYGTAKRPNELTYQTQKYQGHIIQGESLETKLIFTFPFAIKPEWYVQVNGLRNCNTENKTPIGQFAISTSKGYEYPLSGWFSRYYGDLHISVTIFGDIDHSDYTYFLTYANYAALPTTGAANTFYYCYDEVTAWYWDGTEYVEIDLASRQTIIQMNDFLLYVDKNYLSNGTTFNDDLPHIFGDYKVNADLSSYPMATLDFTSDELFYMDDNDVHSKLPGDVLKTGIEGIFEEMSIGDLDDVILTTPTNNDMLVYDGSFKNKTPTEVKTILSLDNVDNTSDANKPVSTATQTALNLKADQATTYTKTEVDNKVSAVYKYKGSVATYGDLPTTGQMVGDVWNVVANGSNYAWNDTGWDPLGGTTELATATTNGLMSKEDFSKLLALPTVENIVKRTATLTTTLATAYSTLGREVAIDGTYGSYFAVIYKNGSTYDIRFVGTQVNGTRSALGLAGTTTIGNAFGLATTDHAKFISGTEFAALATSIYTAGIYTILDDSSTTYLKGATYSLSSAGVRTEIPLAYKNTTTGLTATTVQTAIDEVSNLTSKAEVIQAGINKYYPLLSNRAGELLIRQITSIWNGSAWAATNSLGFGSYALSNNTGVNSNGFGYCALQYNTGSYSNGFGNYALQSNTGANSNGFGHYALRYNTGANSNGFGYYALFNNTGSYSSGFGYSALQHNTGAYSSGFGYSALQYNQKSNNTAVGHNAGGTFLPDTLKNKTCDYTAVDIVNESITITSHGFGATNEYVNIGYTSTTGTAIGGLTIGTIYQIKIIDANTIMFYDGGVKHNLTSQGTGTHTFTPQFAYTNVTLLGANTNPSKDNQVVLGDTNVVNLKLGNYDTTTAVAAGINSTPTSVALTLESIIANTSGYFDTTGSGTSIAPYVIKPKLNISHSENLYVITSSEPASNTYVNIQSQGNQPCNVRYTYSTLFTTYFYALQILNSDGKVRPRLESNLNQTDYRSRITRIANLYAYKFELDINSSTPFILNVLTNFTTTPLKTILIYNEWIAEGDVYKQTNGDLEGIIDEQNPILIGDIDLDYTSEYRDYTDSQIDTARSELSNVYRAVINSGGTVTYYSTSNAFTLSLPIIIRREK